MIIYRYIYVCMYKVRFLVGSSGCSRCKDLPTNVLLCGSVGSGYVQ